MKPLLLLLCVPTLVSAAASDAYLGARLGQSYFHDACTGAACEERTLGAGLYGGVNLTPWLALEAGINDYGEPHAQHASGRTRLALYSAELSTKLTWPLSEQVSLHTRLGTAYQIIDKRSDWVGKQTSYTWQPLLAVGFKYPLLPELSLRAEYQFIDGVGERAIGKADVHFTSLGLTYHLPKE